MQKHKSKFHREDEDVRSQKSHYTNSNKFGTITSPSKNVEVSLEVEFDDEVRSLINNPEKCPSALLDVTVVKPKGLDDYTTKTQILKGNQVKKLLNSMKLEPPDKRKLMEKLFGTGDLGDYTSQADNKKHQSKRKSCLASRPNPRLNESSLALGDIRRTIDNSNSAVFSMYLQKRSNKDISNANPVQQVYTSPNTQHEKIRAMFACKNRKGCNSNSNENNKKDEPCLCQNCAIVGILSDSQKKPFSTEPIPCVVEEKESALRFRRPSRKKSVSFKQTEDLTSASRYTHDDCQAIFKILYGRINELEKRLILQEERAVPKDYFKKIITKLVTHLSKLTHYTTEDRHTGNLLNSAHKETTMPHSSKYKPPTTDKHRYYHVNPVLIDNTFKMPAEKEYDPKPCWSTGPTDSLLKWGGDVINSGRDMKNRLVQVLEETLHNLKKSWEKPQADNRKGNDDLQTIMEELSENLEKTIKSSPKTPRPSGPRRSRNRDSVKDHHRKPSLNSKYSRRNGPAVNVAYINPKMQRWPEESSVSFKVDTSDYDSHLENMSEFKKREYKQEFLKVLENTKKADKFKLWQTIWNQALENRQKKSDYVTIQIPDPKDPLRKTMIHLEYTIGELENLLVNNQENKR